MSELVVPSTPEVPANRLIVMGIRDKGSLGMSAAEAWLDADPDHTVVATTFSPKSHAFVDKQSKLYDGRIDQVTVDWSEPTAYGPFGDWIKQTYGEKRQFAGLVHSIARADINSFQLPAHNVDPQVYLNAFIVSALSLHQGVMAARDVLTPNAGVITFGFGERGRVTPGYGGAMEVAKASLSHWVKVLADSLGDPDDGEPVRVAEIVTGYIQSRSGKSVAFYQPGGRSIPADVSRHFNDSSPLRSSSGDEQRKKAGMVAVAFMDPNSLFSQTTGETIHIDGGWSLRTQGLTPPQR